jgi:hypothetical protein
MTEFQLGSISTGTLRTEDLLPAFTYTMGELTHDPVSNTSKYPTEAMANLWDKAIHLIGTDQVRGHLYDGWTIDPEASGVDDLLKDLADALNELCPPFVYFGTLEGDGADFGFWPDFDAVDESCARKHHRCTHNPETGEIVLEDESVIVQVNDHGNVTVMDMERNVLWSVV